LQSKPLALVNARIFDGTGKPPLPNGAVVIKEGRIADVGSRGSVEIPEDAEVLDLRNMTLLPGLIDAHMHLTGFKTGDMVKEPLLTPFGVFFARAVKDLEALINAGFTTVCDAGGLVGLHLKYAVAEGTIEGPRIVAAGPPLSPTFGHGDTHYLPVSWVDIRTTSKPTPFASLICDGSDECRKAARYAMREGADFIKVMATGGVMSEKDRPEYRQFTLEELKAIVEEAKAAYRFVHAHAQGAEGIKNAIKAGVKVIAHAIYIDEEGIALAKEKGAVIVPTLSVVKRLLEVGPKAGIPEWGLRKAEEIHEVHVENTRAAYKAGAKLATGTDFAGGPFKHGENALELKLFVETLGMSPAEAIISATKNAAEATGLEKDIGTIEKGKIADLIAVEGDPLEDIGVLTDLEKIRLVICNGKVIKKSLS